MRKKNRIFTAVLILLLGIVFAVAMVPVIVNAATVKIRVVDLADLLSDSEEEDLAEELDEISERQQVDIVVVTVSSLDGASAMEYADDFYDNNGYGFGTGSDGILLLVSMEERDWYLSTSGFGITAFTDAGLEHMSNNFLPYLSDGEYAKAFEIYAQQCDLYITQAKSGTPYDRIPVAKDAFSPAGALMIAVVAGFVTALIVTGVMRSGLRSVRSQSAADNYIRRDGLRLTREYELFLYRTITRTERPKQNSPSNRAGGTSLHTSSSSKTHGGRGGKF